MRVSSFFAGLVLGGALVTAGVSPQPLSGQSAPPWTRGRAQFGIGYIANAPDLMGGGGAYVILPRMGGIGIYADFKLDLDSPSNDVAYRGDLTPEEVESQLENPRFLNRQSSWRSFNVALVRPLNPSLWVYGGLGYARSTRYLQYEEVVLDIGRAVLVKDSDAADSRLNIMAGVMVPLSAAINSHFGIETQPRGLTVGVSLKLPSR